MLNDEAKPAKLPRHLITLIVSLLVLLVLFVLIMLWYDHKLSEMQTEEQKIQKAISANSFNDNLLYKSHEKF